MITDTHAHLSDPAFDTDREELIFSLAEKGIGRVLEISCCPDDFPASAALAESHGFIYAAFGIHPEYASSYTRDDMESLEGYLRHPKCRALGETGLDYHWSKEDREQQIALFRRQLDMALKFGLPVSLHIRDAMGDAMEILEEYAPRGLKGVMHCFSGSADTARRCVELGLYIAFGGSLTFKNNKKAPAAAAAVPLEMLLLETDCPYMAPEPYRGRRCDPTMTAVTCAHLALIKGVPPEIIARETSKNAFRLFWPKEAPDSNL